MTYTLVGQTQGRISGGSNKEFESTDTTGRIGTGFLMTHVLSEKISSVGLLSPPIIPSSLRRNDFHVS